MGMGCGVAGVDERWWEGEEEHGTGVEGNTGEEDGAGSLNACGREGEMDEDELGRLLPTAVGTTGVVESRQGHEAGAGADRKRVDDGAAASTFSIASWWGMPGTGSVAQGDGRWSAMGFLQ